MGLNTCLQNIKDISLSVTIILNIYFNKMLTKALTD